MGDQRFNGVGEISPAESSILPVVLLGPRVLLVLVEAHQAVVMKT
jgi:hypothetical protein